MCRGRDYSGVDLKTHNTLTFGLFFSSSSSRSKFYIIDIYIKKIVDRTDVWGLF